MEASVRLRLCDPKPRQAQWPQKRVIKWNAATQKRKSARRASKKGWKQTTQLTRTQWLTEQLRRLARKGRRKTNWWWPQTSFVFQIPEGHNSDNCPSYLRWVEFHTFYNAYSVQIFVASALMITIAVIPIRTNAAVWQRPPARRQRLV